MARHDDVVDALAILGQRASKMSSKMIDAPIKMEPIKGGITVTNGVMYTTETIDKLWESNRPVNVGRRRI
jgi:hypothetical protein